MNPETGNFVDAIFDDEDIVTRIYITSNGNHAFVLIIQCPKIVGERILKYEEVRTSDELTDCAIYCDAWPNSSPAGCRS